LPDTRQIFARTLQAARESADLTQAQLAEILGVDVKTVGNYEGLRGFPRPDVMDTLAEHFGKSVAWFFLEPGQTIQEEKPMTRARALSMVRQGLEFLEKTETEPFSPIEGGGRPVGRDGVKPKRGGFVARRDERSRNEPDELQEGNQ